MTRKKKHKRCDVSVYVFVRMYDSYVSYHGSKAAEERRGRVERKGKERKEDPNYLLLQ